jgi:hypothetical protein
MNPSRRNFTLGVLNGLFYNLGETLIDPTLVIAAFISRLSDSALWVGLILPLLDGSWFLPQLYVSGYLQSQPRKLTFYRYTAVVRGLAWIGVTASVFFIGHPSLLLAVFFLALTIAAIGSGFSGLSFLEIVSKTIPPKARGWFFAWRLTIAGVMGVGASAAVQWILGPASPLSFPNNFGLLFLAATVLFMLGLYAFAIVDEPPDAAVLPRASWIAQIRRALQIVRSDANYRRFLWLRAALMIAGSAVPFYAVYVQQRLDGSLGMIGIYLATFKIANLTANMIFGRASARWGHHRLMQVAAGAGLVMTVMVLGLAAAATRGVAGWAASLWLVPVFVINGVRESGLGVSAQSMLLEIAPQSERSLYLGFTNTFLGIVLLSTGLSGVVVEAFGFPILLIVTLLAYAIALYAALRLRSPALAALPDPDG